MSNLHHYREHGPDLLAPEDLLGIVLNHPGAGRALLDRFGSLHALSTLPFEALAIEPEVGVHRARRLHAAFALARRAATPPRPARIRTASEAAAQFVPRFLGLRQEELHAMYVDRTQRLLRTSFVSRGTVDSTIFDPRLILRQAVEVGAYGLFVAHNHPSGDAEPSIEDLRATQRLIRAADAVGCKVLDHIIVSGEVWVSLATRGELRA
jgi:DNA repair protein RadC